MNTPQNSPHEEVQNLLAALQNLDKTMTPEKKLVLLRQLNSLVKGISQDVTDLNQLLGEKQKTDSILKAIHNE